MSEGTETFDFIPIGQAMKKTRERSGITREPFYSFYSPIFCLRYSAREIIRISRNAVANLL